MSEDEFNKRRQQLLDDEKDSEEELQYYSFADNTGFLGGVLVMAKGFVTGIEKTHAMGINPGGEVQGITVDKNKYPAKRFWNRLLSMDEAENLEPEKTGH